MNLIKQSWNHDTKTACPHCGHEFMWWNGYWPCGGTMDCDRFICERCGHEFTERLGEKALKDHGVTKDERFMSDGLRAREN